MSATLILVAVMAVLYACGFYLMLERSLTRVLLGFMLVGNATNLLILIMGGGQGLAPILDGSTSVDDIADPLPQAFILTSIVITFGVSAFMLGLIYRSWRLSKVDEVQDDAEDLAIAQRDAELDAEHANPDPHDPEVDHLDELTAAHELAETGEEEG
ncbi:multisubunit sodium/proton antiporter MrpC subunit [Homoserinimonas aerilata]|uniref:Multisubunit sodium/proton antiporter MrpC subunit n=1 Tax=Homoserinimonas aerilata TaxID=1162970 RepID=A0A542YHC5_9MICO|nr:Na(+)/H(+) antiporter subunit C [Homoserinimonas aerilata]TQL47503.1 multisubunit sodium/proton antiporter MrpC subunit [Homoserinimonas aerilata]